MDACIFCHVQFNASKNGFLTPAEVWGSFAYMGIEMGAMDVLEFLQAADMDRDGNISYRELVEILADPDREVTGDADAEEDAFTSSSPRGGSAGGFGDGSRTQSTQSTDDDDSALLAVGGGSSPGRRALRKQVSLTPVEPRGEAELTRLQRELLRQEEEEERADEAEESEEEARIRRIIEEEEGRLQVRSISTIIL